MKREVFPIAAAARVVRAAGSFVNAFEELRHALHTAGVTLPQTLRDKAAQLEREVDAFHGITWEGEEEPSA